MYLNKAILSGRITGALELRATKEGNKVTNFCVAINESYKTATGEKKEVVDFIDVTVFGKLAEVSAQYLTKGQYVLVEGKIKTRKYEVNNETRYRTFIQAMNVQFGEKAKEGEKNQVKESPKAESDKGNGPLDPIDYPEEDINLDDIPF